MTAVGAHPSRKQVTKPQTLQPATTGGSSHVLPHAEQVQEPGKAFALRVCFDGQTASVLVKALSIPNTASPALRTLSSLSSSARCTSAARSSPSSGSRGPKAGASEQQDRMSHATLQSPPSGRSSPESLAASKPALHSKQHSRAASTLILSLSLSSSDREPTSVQFS
eukprot:CAMPEP_0171078146 /NCGR_PEP_ID=MMETSP0766_2-20121228/14467_1 /TAXON_ID=439317 /ORGANISM="Gambierdiscus australes, Strain CAWD 149" /LENGTH=166 /DNA_ID=CAMNT_0011535253 /DNA_START=163 /DNA_END=663 /DNA_ORIENTATION=+